MIDNTLEIGNSSTETQLALPSKQLQWVAARFFAETLRAPLQPDWGMTPERACQCRDGYKCERSGKHPSTRDPRGHATRSLDTLADWIRLGRNLAAVPKSYLVLDVELGPGKDGLTPLHTWCDLAGLPFAELTSTFTVRSGGGGLHLWFWLPVGLTPPKGMDGWLPDVDVKTEVKPSDKATIPGSRHASGQPYTFALNALSGRGLLLPRRAPDVLLREVAAGRAWRPIDGAPETSTGLSDAVEFVAFAEASERWRTAEILPPGAERPPASAFAGIALGSLTPAEKSWAEGLR